MTGPEALDNYATALNSAKLAVSRLEEAPGQQAEGGRQAGCLNRLQCAESSLKESLAAVRKLLKKEPKRK